MVQPAILTLFVAFVVALVTAAPLHGSPFRARLDNSSKSTTHSLKGLETKLHPSVSNEEQILFPRNRVSRTIVVNWLDQAAERGSAEFGPNTWSKMHGGGTSVTPNCRPHGMKKTIRVAGPKKGNKITYIDSFEWMAKMDCSLEIGSTRKTDVVYPFVVATGTTQHPSARMVYNGLKSHLINW